MSQDIKEVVKEKYGQAALRVVRGRSSCCCGSSAQPGCDPITSDLYPGADAAQVPEDALRASFGCGNPTALAELKPGETVLDLGSGGGIDVLLSAKRVGPAGRAFGLDMTDEMLALAQRNAATAGVTNVEWLKGQIEEIPLPAASVDVVISNCVVNLAADKTAVFREIARVLRPGGRIGITDIVADDSLSAEERAARGTYTGCIAGALTFSEYRTGLEAAGLEDISLTVSHQAADRMYSVIIKARKGAGAGVETGTGAGADAAAAASESSCGCGGTCR
jgi:SAM-dependent methyltransferase